MRFFTLILVFCFALVALYLYLLSSLNKDVNVVLLTHVNYRTGAMFDIETVTNRVQENGSTIIWDLAHSAGAVPLDLKAINCEFAVGCTYKFLNSGPGSPSFLYVSKDILNHLKNPIKGWFGHSKPFDFENKYKPADNINKFNAGTPSVLSLIPVNTGIDLVLEAGIMNIRNKSIELGKYLIKIII